MKREEAYLAASHSASTGAEEPSFGSSANDEGGPAGRLGGSAVPKAVLLLMMFLQDRHQQGEGRSKASPRDSRRTVHTWQASEAV